MRMVFRLLAFVFAVALAHTVLAGAKTIAAGEIPEEKRFVFLSSTIGPIEAGIVPALEEAFEKDTGIRVRHVGAGTGAALKMAEGGQIDLVLAHARSLEEKFVQDGFGTRRVPIMYNDFVIVGPISDPAGIRGMAKGQAIIRDFGKEKFGAPLFFPNSTEYRKAAGLPAGDF